jgi:putative aldouronate transport system permease protein
MILRMILLASEMTRSDTESAKELINMSTQGVKSAIIVVAIFPIMCIYPFVQKYFVKGIMIGSVKG